MLSDCLSCLLIFCGGRLLQRFSLVGVIGWGQATNFEGKYLPFPLSRIPPPVAPSISSHPSLFLAGNSTLAGAMAAVMANVVLVAYVVVAMREDASERLAEEEERRKRD